MENKFKVIRLSDNATAAEYADYETADRVRSEANNGAKFEKYGVREIVRAKENLDLTNA